MVEPQKHLGRLHKGIPTDLAAAPALADDEVRLNSEHSVAIFVCWLISETKRTVNRQK